MKFDPTLPYRDVVNLSDLHSGNVFGLWPPDFRLSDGGSHGLNKGQKWLWKCWLDAAARIQWWCNIWAYVTIGDLIDGVQYRQGAHEAITVNRPDQADAAELSLRTFMEIAGRAPIFFVQGTDYHDARNGAEIERIAKSMGAVQYEGIGMGYYSHEVLDETVSGVTVNYSHGVGVSGGLYRGTAPDREGIWSALAGREGKLPAAPVVVRAHAHYFVRVEHESKDIFINPCWELQTRYMRKHSPYRMLPSIGLTFIRIWDEGKQVGDSRVEVKKVLYKLPDYYKPHALTLEEVLAAAEMVEKGERGDAQP